MFGRDVTRQASVCPTCWIRNENANVWVVEHFWLESNMPIYQFTQCRVYIRGATLQVASQVELGITKQKVSRGGLKHANANALYAQDV